MATTEIVSQTFRNCIVIFSIITIHSSFVTASVISFQQPASSPEKTLFVNEEAIMFEFNGMEDGEWLIETQSNRILFLSFSDVESSKHLKYSLKIYDNSAGILYPSANNDLINDGKATINDRFYSNGSAVILRFRRSNALQTLNDDAKYELKIQKAVPCPVSLGGSSSCGRVVDELSCNCATFTGRSWANTRTFCLENQMTFLRIDSFDEDFKVYRTWGGTQPLWIGASDITNEGYFKWDNGGRPVSPGYTNWGPNQPANDGGDEDCVHYLHIAFEWHDNDCESLLGGICKDQPAN